MANTKYKVLTGNVYGHDQGSEVTQEELGMSDFNVNVLVNNGILEVAGARSGKEAK